VRSAMAKIEEADDRWIVRERDDGRNCNNWHWTTKDISANVKRALADELQDCVFSPPLSHCRIKSAEVIGDASINNRKGRTFLIYELECKLKWDGELYDGDGKVLESCKGSMKLPDVSPTFLDDLDVDFSCKNNDSPLAKAMRKQGVETVKKLVHDKLTAIQEDVRRSQAEAAVSKPAAPAPAARPVPQPVKIAGASVAGIPNAIKAEAPGAAARSTNADRDSDDDDEEPMPEPLKEALEKLRNKPDEQKVIRLSNCTIRDTNLQPLIEALHHSQCATEELDLAFNRITDAGIHFLIKAIASGCAMELTKLYLGGNKTSVAAMALSQNLKSVRNDLEVNWKPQLREAHSMCVVGNVYNASPAAHAGLVTGDSVVAFGRLQHTSFKSVTESIVPLVKASVNKPIDVVVVRMVEGAQVQQIQLTLTPQQWAGGGLLGCILK